MEIAFLQQQQGEVLTQRRIHRISIKWYLKCRSLSCPGRSPRRRARPLSQAAAAARRNLPGSPPRTDPGHCQQRPGHAREDQDDLNDVHVQAVRVSRRDARLGPHWAGS
jgi:hypothetical protein